MSTDAENWLQIQYPELVELWQKSYLSSVDKTKRYGEECIICRLRSNTGSHYGVYSCEADKQFLKRTFHDKQVYPVCSLQCPPRFRGWCQYCRLKSSLSSGINLKMIRTSYNLKRARSKPTCSLLDTTSSIKRAKAEVDEVEAKPAPVFNIKMEPLVNNSSGPTNMSSHKYVGYESLKMEYDRKLMSEFRNGRIQDPHHIPENLRKDKIPSSQQIKSEYPQNESKQLDFGPNNCVPGYRLPPGQNPRYMTPDMFPPGWPHSRGSAMDFYFSNINYLKNHPHYNPQHQYPPHQQSQQQNPNQHSPQQPSQSQHPPQHPPHHPYHHPPMYPLLWPNPHPDHPLPQVYPNQEQSSPEQSQDSWYQSREYPMTLSPPNSSNSSPPRYQQSSASSHARSYEQSEFKLTRPTAVYAMRPTDLTSETNRHKPHPPSAHNPSIEHNDSLGYPTTNPTYNVLHPSKTNAIDASHEVLQPRGTHTPDTGVDALHPTHYMPSPPYTNSERCELSPMQTEPLDLSSSSASHTSSRPSSRCSSVTSAPSRPPSVGAFPSPRSVGTSLNKWSVNSMVLQEALSIIQPGLSAHSSFKNISHVSDILSESSCG